MSTLGGCRGCLTPLSGCPGRPRSPGRQESSPPVNRSKAGSARSTSATDRTVALVSEEFAGKLTKVARDGSSSCVYRNAAWDVAGSDRGGRTIDLPRARRCSMDPRPLAGHIRSIGADGKHRTFGDLAALEVKHNADGGTSYGFEDLPAACAKQLPKDVEGSYKGHIDSHPYGIEVYGNTIYVADAGANSIVSVDVKSGKAETAALLAAPTAQIHHKFFCGTELSGCVEATAAKSVRARAYRRGARTGRLARDELATVRRTGGPAPGARGSGVQVSTRRPDASSCSPEDVMSPTGLDMDDDGNVYVASLGRAC